VSLPDLINGLFELGGAVMIWLNVKRLYQDKTVKGVDWRVTGFWTAWGLWNLYFYPSLGQWLSFAGGVALVGANAVWLVMAAYYIRRERMLERQARLWAPPVIVMEKP